MTTRREMLGTMAAAAAAMAALPSILAAMPATPAIPEHIIRGCPEGWLTWVSPSGKNWFYTIDQETMDEMLRIKRSQAKMPPPLQGDEPEHVKKLYGHLVRYAKEAQAELL